MKTLLLAICSGILLTLPGCFLDLDGRPADLQVFRESRPLGMTKDLSVDLKYGVGRLEIGKVTDDNLFSLDVQYDRNRFEPAFNFDEGQHASMRLSMRSEGLGTRGRDAENDLRLRVNNKVPVDFDVSTGVSESYLDMTDLQVRRIRIQGGVGKTEVLFDKPLAVPMESFEAASGVGNLTIRGLGNSRVGHLKLEGGVGNTELDFRGEMGDSTTDCTIEVGVGKVGLVVPRDADVEIQAEGSFLSNIHAPAFERSGKTYIHHGGGSARIRIHVASGVGSVNVELA